MRSINKPASGDDNKGELRLAQNIKGPDIAAHNTHWKANHKMVGFDYFATWNGEYVGGDYFVPKDDFDECVKSGVHPMVFASVKAWERGGGPDKIRAWAKEHGFSSEWAEAHIEHRRSGGNSKQGG